MFKFLKQRARERAAANTIGRALHRQIRAALEQDEITAGKRVFSFFAVGYIYGFIRLGFSTLGFNGEQAADKHIKYICDGVIPGRLYRTFTQLLGALELARSLNKDDEIQQFEAGVTAGADDSQEFSPVAFAPANTLERYLLMQIDDLTEQPTEHQK